MSAGVIVTGLLIVAFGVCVNVRARRARDVLTRRAADERLAQMHREWDEATRRAELWRRCLPE